MKETKMKLEAKQRLQVTAAVPTLEIEGPVDLCGYLETLKFKEVSHKQTMRGYGKDHYVFDGGTKGKLKVVFTSGSGWVLSGNAIESLDPKAMAAKLKVVVRKYDNQGVATQFKP